MPVLKYDVDIDRVDDFLRCLRVMSSVDIGNISESVGHGQNVQVWLVYVKPEHVNKAERFINSLCADFAKIYKSASEWLAETEKEISTQKAPNTSEDLRRQIATTLFRVAKRNGIDLGVLRYVLADSILTLVHDILSRKLRQAGRDLLLRAEKRDSLLVPWDDDNDD